MLIKIHEPFCYTAGFLKIKLIANFEIRLLIKITKEFKEKKLRYEWKYKTYIIEKQN